MLGLRSTSLLVSFRVARPTLVAQRQLQRAFGASAVVTEPASKTSTTGTKTTNSETNAKAKPKAKTVKKEKAPAVKKEKKPKTESKRLTPTERALLPPKKPISPYMRYFGALAKNEKARRDAAGETMKLTGAHVLAKEAAQAWKEMTLTEKAKYAIPEEEITQYNKDYAHWAQNIDRGTLDSINKKRKLIGKSRIGAPEGLKKPVGVYALYVQDFFAKHIASDLSPEERATPVLMGKAAETWKTLSESEKQVYRDRADALRTEHHEREEASAKAKAA